MLFSTTLRSIIMAFLDGCWNKKKSYKNRKIYLPCAITWKKLLLWFSNGISSQEKNKIKRDTDARHSKHNYVLVPILFFCEAKRSSAFSSFFYKTEGGGIYSAFILFYWIHLTRNCPILFLLRKRLLLAPFFFVLVFPGKCHHFLGHAPKLNENNMVHTQDSFRNVELDV